MGVMTCGHDFFVWYLNISYTPLSFSFSNQAHPALSPLRLKMPLIVEMPAPRTSNHRTLVVSISAMVSAFGCTIDERMVV